jgi:adenylate cyclase class IV
MLPRRRNIEAKYRCNDILAVFHRARTLGAEEAGILHQSDHFFEAPHGRLKLRQFGDGGAELISYVREDVPAAKGSDYCIYATGAPDDLSAVLTHCLGSRGVVNKTRRLLLWRNTRIHLDDVVGLGTFVELETVIRGQSDTEARAELGEAADALGLDNQALVSCAYLDLLAQASTP